MAASRLLGTAAACVILMSFAAGHRKSYGSGRIKAAIVICQQIFVAGNFPFKIIFEKCSKTFFFGVEIPVLELEFLTPLRIVLFCFATRSLQIAL